jgi:uncharacterized protein with PIN domain
MQTSQNQSNHPCGKFICDAMLHKLGRWLRLAGYDVLIAEDGETDRSIAHKAVSQDRLLLTRDRGFAERKNMRGRLLILDAEEFYAMAQEITPKLGIDWLHKPFSRCIKCNTELVLADRSKFRSFITKMELEDWPLYRCPSCNKLFWEGSHVGRIRRTLQNFNGGRWYSG